jgi:hypothetical protein
MNGKPVLVIISAGMGSRYGGLKQIDSIDAYGNRIKEDKETVVNAIKELKKTGIYPERLWEEQ